MTWNNLIKLFITHCVHMWHQIHCKYLKTNSVIITTKPSWSDNEFIEKFVWCSHVVFTCGVHMWCSHLVLTSGAHIADARIVVNQSNIFKQNFFKWNNLIFTPPGWVSNLNVSHGWEVVAGRPGRGLFCLVSLSFT